MRVAVDLATGCVTLEGWEDQTALDVRVDGGPDHGPDADAGLSALLASAGVGRVGPGGDVLFPPDALRGLARAAASAAGCRLGAGWDEGFAGMLAYADDRGWIDDDGAVRAHVEWRDAR